MTTLVATAVVRPYKVDTYWNKRFGVREVSSIRYREGRQRRGPIYRGREPTFPCVRVRKTAFVCRLCERLHNDRHHTSSPRDEFGFPQVCYNCWDWKLARKVEHLPGKPRQSGKKYDRWIDQASLYAVARLYIQEYEKWRKKT